TVMKLARVFLLAPAVAALGLWVGQSSGAKAPVPWFAFGFLGLVVLGSTGLVPGLVVDASRTIVPLMLATSVAALGLSTDLSDCLRISGGRRGGAGGRPWRRGSWPRTRRDASRSRGRDGAIGSSSRRFAPPPTGVGGRESPLGRSA
ncbi:MAG: putative sulfate exporter family transporter, partial [Acetobacteraceae bacterium]